MAKIFRHHPSNRFESVDPLVFASCGGGGLMVVKQKKDRRVVEVISSRKTSKETITPTWRNRGFKPVVLVGC